MSISADTVRYDAETMRVGLSDGRVIGVPLAWFPRLLRAGPAARTAVEISPLGLHWEAPDADVSVAGLLAGRGIGDGSGARLREGWWVRAPTLLAGGAEAAGGDLGLDEAEEVGAEDDRGVPAHADGVYQKMVAVQRLRFAKGGRDYSVEAVRLMERRRD